MSKTLNSEALVTNRCKSREKPKRRAFNLCLKCHCVKSFPVPCISRKGNFYVYTLRVRASISKFKKGLLFFSVCEGNFYYLVQIIKIRKNKGVIKFFSYFWHLHTVVVIILFDHGVNISIGSGLVSPPPPPPPPPEISKFSCFRPDIRKWACPAGHFVHNAFQLLFGRPFFGLLENIPHYLYWFKLKLS